MRRCHTVLHFLRNRPEAISQGLHSVKADFSEVAGKRPPAVCSESAVRKLISTKKGSFVMLRLSNQPHNGGAKDGKFEMSFLTSWIPTLVELWAWNLSGSQLVNRGDSPWDDPERRPSHANRRKALRAQIMRGELSIITTAWSLPKKIIRLVQTLMTVAA